MEAGFFIQDYTHVVSEQTLSVDRSTSAGDGSVQHWTFTAHAEDGGGGILCH